MKYFGWKIALSSILTLFVAIFLLAACQEGPRPAITGIRECWTNGRPTYFADIDPNGTIITDINIHWAEALATASSPDLNNVSGFYILDGQIWRADNGKFYFPSFPNWNQAGLPGQINETVLIRNYWDYVPPLESDEKVVFRIRLDYEANVPDSDAIFPVYSELTEITIDDTCASSEEPPINIGGGAPVPSCPSDADPQGGLAAPVLDPTYSDGPLNGDTGVGQYHSTASVTNVGLRWRAVDGAAPKSSKAYQVEILRGATSSCIDDWSADGPVLDTDDIEGCVLMDVNTNGTAHDLLPNEPYRWRVRASCHRAGGGMASGPFTPFQQFTTAGE